MGKDMQNVPKLRFGEFSDDLEQYKVPYMMERIAATAESGPLPSIEYDDIEPDIGLLNKDVASKEAKKRGIVFQQGDVLFGKLRPYLKNWLYCTFPGVAVGDFWVLRPWHSDGLFFYYFMQTAGFQGVANQSTGSKMPRADWNLVSEYGWSIPHTRDEQHRIGMLLRSVDDLVILQMRKLSKLQDIKKALLAKMFPAEGENVPALRFKGFTDAWEQRRLGEYGSVSMNKRIFKNQTAESGDIPFYKIGTFGGVPDAYISRDLYEEYKKKYSYPKKGDVLISASGSIGRTVVYDGEEAYYQDSNIVWLNHDSRLDDSFLLYVYAIVKWSGIEGSTISRLYNENILSTRVIIPIIEEQRKIGEILSRVDTLITLHQRKLSKLKDIKKALLNNMFPGGDI